MPGIHDFSTSVYGDNFTQADSGIFTREFVRGAGIATVESLNNNLVAHMLTADCPPSIIEDGVEIARIAFPHERKAAQRARANYDRIRTGQTVITIDAPGEADHGLTFEASCFFVYYLGDAPAAIGGIYRYLNEPDRFWLGRFGLSPTMRGKGLGETVLEHNISCVKRMGGTSLSLFTEDNEENSDIHRYYEKRGFVRKGPLIREYEQWQRVYRKNPL